MIVNNTNLGWEIIYQRAHGLLAATIAQYWKKAERPKKWIETIAAICEHDDSQQTWHAHHHLDAQGTPQDFTLQPPDLKQAKRITEVAKFKSGWIALLISYHISNLYSDHKNSGRALQKFLKEQDEFRKRYLKMLNIKKETLEMAYRLMYWCDRASLILCKNNLPSDEKRLEVAAGPKIKRYDIWQTKEGLVKVTPWPFQVKTFEVNVEARLISTMVFQDDAHLHKTIERTPVTIKKWQFRE